MKFNCFIKSDNLKALGEIPDDSIDLVYADPPSPQAGTSFQAKAVTPTKFWFGYPLDVLEYTHPQSLRGDAGGRKVLRSSSCRAIRDFTAIGGLLQERLLLENLVN